MAGLQWLGVCGDPWNQFTSSSASAGPQDNEEAERKIFTKQRFNEDRNKWKQRDAEVQQERELKRQEELKKLRIPDGTFVDQFDQLVGWTETLNFGTEGHVGIVVDMNDAQSMLERASVSRVSGPLAILVFY